MLLDVLAKSLRLLHPLIPFVSEEIYGKLPAECKQSGKSELLINSNYPAYDEKQNDPEGEKRFAFLQDFVRQIRTCRSECTVTPDKKLRASVKTTEEFSVFLEENSELAKLLAGLEELRINKDAGKTHAETAAGGDPVEAGAIGLAGTDWDALLYLGAAVNLNDLKAKFEKNLAKDKGFISVLEKKINNPDFVKNAPPELVEAEKQKLAEAKERTGKVEAYLKGLQ